MSGRTDPFGYYITGARRAAFRVVLASLACIYTLAVVSSCSSGSTPTAPTVRPSPSPSPTLRGNVTETAQAAKTTPTGPNPAVPVTLTVWLPPEMALSAQSSGQAIQIMNQSFQETNPGVLLEVIPKASYGAAGLANALAATRPVVPSRLPDVIAVDSAEVDLLVAQNLLVPLDDLVPQTMWQDLYPSTANASLAGLLAERGTTTSASAETTLKRFAIPFQVDIDFVAYNAGNIQLAPRTWAEMEGSEAKYVFPAGQGNGDAADAFLIQYLAQGGQLVNEMGRPAIDSAIMAEVLAVYRQAVDAGVVPIAVRSLQTREHCWDAYMQDRATMTNVSSSLYQREKGALRRTHYASIPTASGVSSTLARSWSWAIVTTDPLKQELASRYIVAALRPQALASWCLESHHLPAHRQALPLVVSDESYRSFLEEQLQRAYPYPYLTTYSKLQSIITKAIEDVLDGVSTPERAAVTAAAMAARLR